MTFYPGGGGVRPRDFQLTKHGGVFRHRDFHLTQLLTELKKGVLNIIHFDRGG